MTHRPKYAVPPRGCQSWLTPGKRYALLPDNSYGGNKWPDSFAIVNNNNNKIFCANDYSYHARGYWCFTDEDADTRPSGTCVDAGPAQFLDQQTCEPVNPRPSALGRVFAQDDATVLLISHGWDREDAQAFVAAIAKMIEGRS
jgi:hypothetical protein